MVVITRGIGGGIERIDACRKMRHARARVAHVYAGGGALYGGNDLVRVHLGMRGLDLRGDCRDVGARHGGAVLRAVSAAGNARPRLTRSSFTRARRSKRPPTRPSCTASPRRAWTYALSKCRSTWRSLA